MMYLTARHPPGCRRGGGGRWCEFEGEEGSGDSKSMAAVEGSEGGGVCN